jgi:hypothetical protein
MLGGTIDDFTDGLHIGTEATDLAASTINDFTYGRQGALSRTSPMDSKDGEKRNNLKQNNSMNHQMELKLTLAISKKENLQSLANFIL